MNEGNMQIAHGVDAVMLPFVPKGAFPLRWPSGVASGVIGRLRHSTIAKDARSKI